MANHAKLIILPQTPLSTTGGEGRAAPRTLRPAMHGDAKSTPPIGLNDCIFRKYGDPSGKNLDTTSDNLVD